MSGKHLLVVVLLLGAATAHAAAMSVAVPSTPFVNGSIVPVTLQLTGASSLAGYQATLRHSAALQFVNATEGTLLGAGCNACTFFLSQDNGSSTLFLGVRFTGGQNGTGPLATITFRAAGTADVNLTSVQLSDPAGNALAVTTANSTVTITSPRLTLFDDTDFQTRRAGDTVTFSAVYELLNGQPIRGADCRISFNNVTTPMSFDAAGNSYTFLHTFSTVGTFPWRVTCDGDPANATFTISPATCTDADADGYGPGCARGPDCNDTNAAVNPGRPERCGNAVDDNCNGQTDEGCNTPPSSGSVPSSEAPVIAHCVEQWQCSTWSACVDGERHRDCADTASCPTMAQRPPMREPCATCGDGKRNGDEQGIDCGGSCVPCAIRAPAATLQAATIQGSLSSPIAADIKVTNTGADIGDLRVRIPELGVEQQVGALLPSEEHDITVSLDPLRLVTQGNVTLQVLDGKRLLAEQSVPVALDVPAFGTIVRNEEHGAVAYVIVDNRHGTQRNGLEVELNIRKDHEVLFTELLGQFAASPDTVTVERQALPGLTLRQGSYQVESTLYEKGVRQQTQVFTAALAEQGGLPGAVVVLVAVSILIVAIGFLVARKRNLDKQP